MQKSLHIDPGKCTGCLQCEMACSYEHTGTFNPSRSFIKVFTFHHEGRFAPYTCTQCDEAWCLHACPVEAITVDKATGAKVVNESTCVGCKVCTIACPFGTINYSQNTGKVSNAIFVAVIRNVLLPARPMPSLTSTPTGPVTIACSPRRQRACLPPKSPRRFLSKHGRNESCHGQEKY